jgi:hypothetical protein
LAFLVARPLAAAPNPSGMMFVAVSVTIVG